MTCFLSFSKSGCLDTLSSTPLGAFKLFYFLLDGPILDLYIPFQDLFHYILIDIEFDFHIAKIHSPTALNFNESGNLNKADILAL